jgi:hypothetical protein
MENKGNIALGTWMGSKGLRLLGRRRLKRGPSCLTGALREPDTVCDIYSIPQSECW